MSNYQFAKIKRNNGDTSTVWETADFIAQGKRKEIEVEIADSGFSLCVKTDDSDLVKSSSLLKKFANAYTRLFEFIASEIKASSHSQKEILGELIQELEDFVDIDELIGKPHSEQIEYISEKIGRNHNQTADILLRTYKRIVEMRSHATSFHILHLGEDIKPDLRTRNLKRAILNIWHAFDTENLLRLRLKFDDDIVVPIDFKIFDAALFNFFDNAKKYSMPSSEIHVFFKEKGGNGFQIIFSMDSRLIKKDELSNICKFGYRGESVRQGEEGSGIGMYICQKAFALNNLSLTIEPDWKQTNDISGIKYVRNVFILEKSNTI